MAKVTCECGMTLASKAGYLKHKARKNPCIALKAEAVEKGVVEEKAVENAIKEETKEDPVVGEFREASKKINAELSKEVRQAQGIFFTPKKARDVLFATLANLGVRPKRIIEPSCGSGEFLWDARQIYPDAVIHGIEKNETVYQTIAIANANANVHVHCCDFLTWKGTGDLIIGNPPYFVIKAENAKKRKELAAQYAEALTGRPNIYIMFLYKCLTEHLEEDGFLAFIIPTSLYNCSYYQPMRDYIQKHTTIHHVETLNKPGFYETGQETMLIVLQKGKRNDDYIFRSNSGNIYISPYYKELYAMTKGAATLSDMGLGVKTGSVIWNHFKSQLANEGTPLIYSSNIKNSELILDNLCGKERKQYIGAINKPVLSGPHILVDRGYGNSFQFNAVLVTMDGFYAENHVNVIYPKTDAGVENLQRVRNSFREARTSQFIKWFIGNGSISSADLETIIPIF